MRQIKFRGQRVDDNEWVYGGISIFQNEATIFDCECVVNSAYDVAIETVGQFTGVMHRDCEKYRKGEFNKDGNAFYKEVYEGDIVEFKVDPSFYINAKLGDRYIIEYFGAGFFMKPISWGNRKIDAQNYVGLLPPYQTSNMRNHYEVIGNIHENQDLLNQSSTLTQN